MALQTNAVVGSTGLATNLLVTKLAQMPSLLADAFSQAWADPGAGPSLRFAPGASCAHAKPIPASGRPAAPPAGPARTSRRIVYPERNCRYNAPGGAGTPIRAGIKQLPRLF